MTDEQKAPMRGSSIPAHFADQDRVESYLEIYDSIVEQDAAWDAAFGRHRQNLIVRRLGAALPESARILEIGSGIGELTAELLQAGYTCDGIDQSAAMVAKARERFAARGFAPDTLRQADLFDLALEGFYDAVVANGVIPYYQDQNGFLAKLATLVKPGGKIAVTHRNALFNLVAMNEGTTSFLFDEVFGAAGEDFIEPAKQKLAAELPTLGTPKSTTVSDDLWRSAENPMTVGNLYSRAGLELKSIFYTFIHPVPPRFGDRRINGGKVLDLSRQYENRWQGAFAGSQFLVIAERP